VAVRTHGRDILPAADIALDARVVAVGVWLFLAANLFFFAGWYFAFFYLRALNNNQAWIIQGMTRPNKAYGLVVLLLALADRRRLLAGLAAPGSAGHLPAAGPDRAHPGNRRLRLPGL